MAFKGSGKEKLVNTYTDSEQSNPGIGANPATGGFQVVWQSDGQDGSFWGVFGQNFNAKGKMVGSEISIADLTGGDQENPDVAFDANGNGMWVWQSTAAIAVSGGVSGPPVATTFPAANYQTRSKTFGYQEDAGSSATYSNTELSRDGRWDPNAIGKDAIEPTVISIGDEMFVTGWYRKDEDRAEFRYTVDQVSADHSKVISSQGDYSRGFAEAEKTGLIYTNFGDVELLRTVQDRRFGDLKEFLVVTTLASDLDATDGVIQFQIFQESISAGLAFKYGDNLPTDYSDRFVLADSGTTGDASRPRAAILKDGGFAIVWQERNESASDPADWDYDVYVQVFNADLTERSVKVAVDVGKGDQTLPEITALKDGGFAITWTDSAGKGDDVRLQRFNEDGWKLGLETRVNAKAKGDQADSVITELKNGDVAVAFESSTGDADSGGVMVRIFDALKVGSKTSETIVATDANEKIKTLKGDDTVDGAGGNDSIDGGVGNDDLTGGAGKDKLKGGKGDGMDRLDGGAGNDIMTGGGGSDEFVYGDGKDRITDFEVGVDTLSLEKGLVKPKKLKKVVDVVDGDLVFDFGKGDVLTIDNVKKFADISDDISFV